MTFRDLSAQRPAAAIAAALVESERRFAEITETSLQAKLVHRYYKPLFANSAFLRLTGFASKEQLLTAGDILPLFDLQTQGDPLTAWERAVSGGPIRSRILMHRRDGEAFLADAFARPILWDDEPAIALALLDVTAEDAARRALALAKAEAEAASRAKRRFLSAASHGLRTPLHAAMGRLQLLQRANLNPEHADLADEAMRACCRLLHHVDDVLDCAAMETGELDWTKERFKPAAAVDAAVRIARDSIEGVNVVVSEEGDPSLEFLGDDRRTQRIALALVEEAILRGPLGPIEIHVCLDAEGVSLAIRAPCALNGARHDETGNGPVDGMAVARSMCSAMGGVMVERSPSEHLWSVTAFLPFALAAKPVAPGAKAPGAKASAPNAARILIVEDNAGNRRLLQVILTSLGQTAFAVPGGAEAVAEIQRNRYDLVLMDLSMPGVDGFEATRRIRALGPSINKVPIVALTASTGVDMRERAQEAGMDGFLQKPVEIPKLAAAVALFASGAEAVGSDGLSLSVNPAEIQDIQGQNDNDKGDDGGERGHARPLSCSTSQGAAS